MITGEQVRGLFKYKNGCLYRKTKRTNRVKVGDRVGYTGSTGYMVANIGCTKYLVHRLVWLYHYDYTPENYIDHIDRDKLNNRIENLREVSNQCNMRNTGNLSSNTSGVKGVTFSSAKSKWVAQITVDGCNKYLGIYKSFDEAVLTRLAAEQCLSWSSCESKSPAYVYYKDKILIGSRRVI